MTTIYDFHALDISGRDVPISDYRGKVWTGQSSVDTQLPLCA